MTAYVTHKLANDQLANVDLGDVTSAERGFAVSGLLNRYQVIIVRSNGESLYLTPSRLCHAMLF